MEKSKPRHFITDGVYGINIKPMLKSPGDYNFEGALHYQHEDRMAFMFAMFMENVKFQLAHALHTDGMNPQLIDEMLESVLAFALTRSARYPALWQPSGNPDGSRHGSAVFRESFLLPRDPQRAVAVLDMDSIRIN